MSYSRICPVCGKEPAEGKGVIWANFHKTVCQGRCNDVASACSKDTSKSKRGRFRNKSEWIDAIARYKADKLQVHIRWMIARDMPEVLKIESSSFEYPWSEEEFKTCFRQRNVIGMVAEANGIVGYMVYALEKTYLGVINFAVHPEMRFKGVGKAMVDKLLSKLSSHRRTKLRLDVRETNLDAQLFFKRLGFVATTYSRGFYANGDDAITMEYRLEEEYEYDWQDSHETVNRLPAD